MRKILFSLLLLNLFALAGWAKSPELLQFAKTSIDFGTVTEQAEVVCEYEFTNVADEPVAVLSVSASCGCTQPEYPVKPLKPGEKGVIKVTFIPDGQTGNIIKDIKVRYQRAKATSSKSTTLRLKGYVKK